jgi:hypothetical protein
LVRNTFASAALASNAWLSPSTAVLPQRAVSFINVVGWDTAPSNAIRQHRRHAIESLTSRHNDSLTRCPRRSRARCRVNLRTFLDSGHPVV